MPADVASLANCMGCPASDAIEALRAAHGDLAAATRQELLRVPLDATALHGAVREYCRARGMSAGVLASRRATPAASRGASAAGAAEGAAGTPVDTRRVRAKLVEAARQAEAAEPDGCEARRAAELEAKVQLLFPAHRRRRRAAAPPACASPRAASPDAAGGAGHSAWLAALEERALAGDMDAVGGLLRDRFGEDASDALAPELRFKLAVLQLLAHVEAGDLAAAHGVARGALRELADADSASFALLQETMPLLMLDAAAAGARLADARLDVAMHLRTQFATPVATERAPHRTRLALMLFEGLDAYVGLLDALGIAPEDEGCSRTLGVARLWANRAATGLGKRKAEGARPENAATAMFVHRHLAAPGGGAAAAEDAAGADDSDAEDSDGPPGVHTHSSSGEEEDEEDAGDGDGGGEGEDGGAEDGGGGGDGGGEEALREAMQRLMEITNVPEDYARALLRAHEGDLEAAVATVMDV